MTVPQTVTKHELETQLIEKCWKDPDFKAAVLDDPKGAFEDFLGQTLPESFQIFIHQDDASHLHLTVPRPPQDVGELSDEELENVAGGTEGFIVLSLVSVVTTINMGYVAAKTKW